jgi:hypothetical protein
MKLSIQQKTKLNEKKVNVLLANGEQVASADNQLATDIDNIVYQNN